MIGMIEPIKMISTNLQILKCGLSTCCKMNHTKMKKDNVTAGKTQVRMKVMYVKFFCIQSFTDMR